MALDLDAFLAQLREQEELRAELRQLLLGDTPDVQQALADLASAGQRTEEGLATLAAAQERTDDRVSELSGRMAELAEQMTKLTQEVRTLAEQMTKLTQEVRTLAERLDNVIIRADRTHGYLVERRYAEKGHAYFARIARRLEPLGPTELDELFEQAGLSEEDADEVRYADSIFACRLRPDDTPGYLVVETSVTIGHQDVDRAHKRAFVLRLKGLNAVPVVAGEQISELVSVAARRLGVWQVTDGSTVSPDDPGPVSEAS